MSGYTPLFGSLTSGTLCGKWPDIGLWPIVLSLADKNGVVDATQVYIASVTGLSIDEVTACMARFCKPDPHSRSDAEGGARLVLLDEHRSWGWRIVNFGFYREKARLTAKAARESESGANAARMADRRRPPETAADPLSNSNSNSNSNTEKNYTAAAPPSRADGRFADGEFEALKTAFPERSGAHRWWKAHQCLGARLKEGHSFAEILSGVERYARWCIANGKVGTEYVLQAATFLGREKHFLLPWNLPPKPETDSERILRKLGQSQPIEHEHAVAAIGRE